MKRKQEKMNNDDDDENNNEKEVEKRQPIKEMRQKMKFGTKTKNT